MHGWFCPIRLIHLIGRKSLHFEKTRLHHQITMTISDTSTRYCMFSMIFTFLATGWAHSNRTWLNRSSNLIQIFYLKSLPHSYHFMFKMYG